MKKEYANPSVSVVELDCNGMLCSASRNIETGETEEMPVYPGETTDKPAL